MFQMFQTFQMFQMFQMFRCFRCLDVSNVEGLWVVLVVVGIFMDYALLLCVVLPRFKRLLSIGYRLDTRLGLAREALGTSESESTFKIGSRKHLPTFLGKFGGSCWCLFCDPL